jgi:tryptophan synthase alpha subunit
MKKGEKRTVHTKSTAKLLVASYNVIQLSVERDWLRRPRSQKFQHFEYFVSLITVTTSSNPCQKQMSAMFQTIKKVTNFKTAA